MVMSLSDSFKIAMHFIIKYLCYNFARFFLAQTWPPDAWRQKSALLLVTRLHKATAGILSISYEPLTIIFMFRLLSPKSNEAFELPFCS